MPPPRPSVSILDTATMLREELDEIERRRGDPAAPAPDQDDPAGETHARRAARLRLSALCLSGGGIRSAAFCLGVLQSLAAKGMLTTVDYLSTVSGGGFIGGWLQMVLREAGGAAAAAEQLGPSGAALDRLRHYTNYLTPQSGPFSSDSWAAIALYGRNLLLNWMVFAPLILVIAMAPIFDRTLLAALRGFPRLDQGVLAASFVALTVATVQACLLLPSHRTVTPPGFATPAALLWRLLAPTALWAWLMPFVIDSAIVAQRFSRAADSWWARDAPALAALTYFAALLTGYGIAWLRPGQDAAGRRLYRRNIIRWIAATAGAAGLICLGMHALRPSGALYHVVAYAMIDDRHRLLIDTETILTVLLPFWLILVHVLQTTFYTGLRKEGLLADLDREWLARLSGILLRLGCVWMACAFCAIILPRWLGLVGPLGEWERQWVGGTAIGATGLGAIGAWLGKTMSANIEAVAKKTRKWNTLVLDGFGLLFGAGLLVVAGSVLEYGMGRLQQAPVPHPGGMAWPLLIQITLALVFAVLVVAFGGINVNRFSLHAVYRNRLCRAFLGAARAHRRPDPFTGFDPQDNPRLADLAACAPGQRLFPVINITLNVTAGNNAALAERKAESFTATPLACGSAALRPERQGAATSRAGAFARTRDYAGRESRGDTRGLRDGPRLGSMLTISGAALSPNWGYHSSRVTAFLMTLFNVRLGAWLPNPAVATPDDLSLSKPKNSVLALMGELFGVTTDTKQAVYLSDGGHFENLGLYEMLRRRCRWIVAIDAGEDAACAMFDLGNAIRKAAIDLAARVEMRPMRFYARETIEQDKSAGAEALGVAIGDITYAEENGKAERGTMIYLKPSFLSGIPADVRAYGKSDPSFPHDSTMEQWFSESQFESYRKLGAWQMDQVIAAMPGHDHSLEGLFEAAERVCGTPGSTT